MKVRDGEETAGAQAPSREEEKPLASCPCLQTCQRPCCPDVTNSMHTSGKQALTRTGAIL